MFKHKNVGDKIFCVVNIIILTLFALACIYPFYYIFIGSISSPSALSKGVFLLPKQVTFDSYKAIFYTKGIFRSVGVSVARTVIGTLLSVMCSTFVAYLFSYKEVFCRKLLYRYFIMTMYIGAGFIPYYLLMDKLQLKNTFWIYVIPGAVSAYFIILIKTYIESIPTTLREAAEIDGAGIVKIFYQVIFPLCKPIIACCVVFSAVGQWNVWSDTMYFITDSKLYTLQYKLYVMLSNNMAEAVTATKSASAGASLASAVTPASLRLAMTFVTIIPVLCVYPFMQKYFLKGMMLGAVKG